MKNKFSIAMSLAVVLAMLLTSLAFAQSTPTISSDLADYAPGQTVTLFGAGWQAGESVHIYVNDSVGSSWSLNSGPDPIADGNGGFTYQFQLPNWFVATYSVTGTGAMSGTATTTFTDGNLKFVETGLPSGTSWSVTWNGNTLSSTTDTITFGGQQEGPFDYSIPSVGGYVASPNSGSATRPGQGTTTVNVAFAASDITAPTASPTQSPAANGAGWNNSDVTVTWHWADNAGGSGIDSANCSTSSISSGEGTITLTATCKDLKGNQGSASYTVKVDKTAPTASASASPAANANGWNNSDVTVSYSCTDSGPSGVNNAASDLGNDVLTSSGTASGTCVDMAGNSAIASYTAQIDKVKPVIAGNRLPAANANGWNITDVAVSFSCTDSGGSGIDVNTVAGATVSAEGANQSVTNSGTCTDKAGNTADPATVSGVNIDKTAPTISGAPDRAANAKGWYNADVIVSFTCDDALSGVATCSGSSTLGEGAAQSVTGNVTDKAGNSASATVSGINVDETAPTISGAPTTAPNANGWYNGDVTIHWTCSETLSGLDGTCPANSVITGEGNNLSATASISDLAGNSASATVNGIKIDRTAPTISGAPTTTPNANGWYNADVTVSFTCGDALSGVETCPGPSTLGEGSSQSVTGNVTDKAGNSASATVSGINIDETKPAIVAAATTSPNGNGWYNSDVTVHFTCTDALSGIPSSACPADQVLSTEGAAVASTAETVTDAAGNTSDPSNVITVKIDKTAPTATASAAPAPNANGWNNTDVTVTFSGSDALSDIDSCAAAVVLNTEGAGQSASGTCTDKAGNVSASATASNINIDKTAPSVALVGGPADGTSYYFGFVPAAPTCSASDALSSLDGSCSVSGYGTGLGSHTVTASAADKAGNSASASVSYTVSAWKLQGFYQPVDMGKLNIAKNGSTVPLKFEVFAGDTELTNTSFILGTFVQKLTCGTGLATDDIENYATGGTSLRYDTTGGQFIFNWQTPKFAGNCYRVTLTTADGSKIEADFKLK